MSGAEKPDADSAAELARDLYRALGNGDRRRLAELLHPDFEGRTSEGLPLNLGGVYTGPDRMRREFWGRIAKNFHAWSEPEEFHLLDDGRLLVLGRYRGKGLASGAPLDAAFVHLLRFTDGRISGIAQYTDTARWIQALTGESTPSDSGAEPAAAPEPARRAASAPAARTMELTGIKFDVTDGLVHITLNRPEARNALDARMADELLEAARRCTEQKGLRAVLFSGAGPAFTVGGDIDVFARAGEGRLPSLLDSMAGTYHQALDLFSKLEVPIVCGVHGAAAGGGLGLVYCADLVLAAESTKFTLGFAALGLTCDGGASWFLPRLVGPRRTAELFFEQRTLTAHEAVEWGLVSRVVPDDAVQAEALEVARKLASGPTRAFAGIRRLLRESASRTLSEQLTAEVRVLSHTAETADATEGIASFVGKREPKYQGR